MPDNNAPLQVGLALPRPDGPAKVRGLQKYAADFYAPDMLWAGVKRAGVACARLISVDASAARRLPGAAAVLTHKDVKGTNRQGVVRKDQPVLADDRVRHAGDAIALAVAESPGVLARALDLIQVELEEAPGVFDPQQALAPGAPLVHQDHEQGNLLLTGEAGNGRGRDALAECDQVVETVLDLPRQEHVYLETEAGWAILDDHGVLRITASTQTPFRDRAETAEALGLDMASVRILAPQCGGAFGGKDGVSVQSLLGLAALACPGRPIKMWWRREESFLASPKRHPARIKVRLGARADGELHALDVDMVYDTGPYDHLGGVVAALGLEHAGGPYRIPHASLRSRAVYTNNPIGGAFRGFGVPQAAAAVEQAVDVMAARLDMDPLELRRRNLAARGQQTPAGVTLTSSNGLAQCLGAARRHPLWRERAAWASAAGAFRRRGVGAACLLHGMGYGPIVPDAANAKVKLTRQGKFRVYGGVVDMGQGNGAAYLQIAGDILCQPPGRMELIQPDTARTLNSGSSSASRTTYTYGAALIQAAESLKQRILERTADMLMAASADQVSLLPGRVRRLSDGREIPLERLAEALDAAERTATSRFRAPASPQPAGDPALALHGFPHVVYSFAVHLAAVEVDELTGGVEVIRYLAFTDVGRVLNPLTLDQQMHGGIAQGLGYALLEEMPAPEGIIAAPDLATYLIPTALDLPDMETAAIQTFEPSGPYGMKGAGEICIDGPLPATANALAAACGTPLFKAPFTAERVLAALAGKGGEE